MSKKYISIKTLKWISAGFAISVGFFLVIFLYIYINEHGVDNFIVEFTVFGFVMFLIATSIMAIGINSINKRIHNLKVVATEIGKGNFESKTNIRGDDEFAVLARSIESMGTKLKNNFESLKRASVLEKEKEYSENKLDVNVEKLKRTEIAITNILEDLFENNKKIEQKVKDRTEELSIEKNKLNQITENMNIGAMLLDENSKVIFLNREAKKILNIRGNNFKTSFNKLCAKFKNHPVKEYSKKCLAGDDAKIAEAESDDVIYEILFKCLKDNDKVFARLIWIRDVTDEKLLERSKSELVAVASHQLKTPLTVTKGNTEMLLDESFGKLNKEQRQVVQQTSDANNKLIALVNEMLDITKIEKNKLLMQLEKVDVTEILDSVVNSLKDYAERHNIPLCYNKPKEKFPMVLADKLKVNQIFQNLIENAIQYSKMRTDQDACSVNIDVNFDANNINISVSDNGIGIPKKEQDKIFERFYRASNAVKFASSGTGLGLYIVKSVIEKLNGTIGFESKENVGTKFSISLPIVKRKKEL